MRERNQIANSGKYFCNDDIGGVEIMDTNEFPYFCEINTRFRVERVSDHKAV